VDEIFRANDENHDWLTGRKIETATGEERRKGRDRQRERERERETEQEG